MDAVPPNIEEPVLALFDPNALVVLLPKVLLVLPKSPPVLAVLALLFPNIEDPPNAVLGWLKLQFSFTQACTKRDE